LVKEVIKMKKLLAIALSVCAVFTLASCGHTTKTNTTPAPTQSSPASVAASSAPSSAQQPEAAKITDAESVVTALADAGLPIDNIIVFTAETDDATLLGRPNQYTSRVKFADTRADQAKDTSPTGGCVEFFNNSADADARYKYLDEIIKSIPMFAQYLYLTDNVILRIDGDLTPEQADEYKTAFDAIMGVK
jgi:hypothetical protein